MVWDFIGVYKINRTLHDRAETLHFSSSVEEYFTRSSRSLVKYFSTRTGGGEMSYLRAAM